MDPTFRVYDSLGLGAGSENLHFSNQSVNDIDGSGPGLSCFENPLVKTMREDYEKPVASYNPLTIHGYLLRYGVFE